MFRRIGLAVALLAGLAFGDVAHAGSIGINFTADSGVFQPGPHPMLATDLAGVVAQTNWNNANPQVSGSTANVNGGAPIHDNTGAATGLTILWGGGGNVNEVSDGVPNNADAKLYTDYLETDFNTGVPITVVLGNITYSKYDVIVYVGDFIGQGGFVSSTTLNLVDTVFYANANSVPFGGYVEATGTGAGNANLANYVEFDDVTGASFRIDVARVSGNRGAIAAIQIVDRSDIPEPATLGLLGAALAVFGCARRRGAA